MAAFAMILPANLEERQLACLQQYGKEHCDEIRVDARNPATTIFAGVPRHRFSSKKSAQIAFGANLKSWGIERNNRFTRGWYRELTVEEYAKEFHDVPGTAGRRMKSLVQGFMDKVNKVALSNVIKAMAEQEKAEKEKAEEKETAKRETDAKRELETAIVEKVAAHSALSAEELQGKIAILRGHLELLSRLRDENPNLGLYLFPGWENKTPQEYLESRVRRGFKRRFNEVFDRKYEEKREAVILQQLERALEEREAAILQELERELEEREDTAMVC